MQQLLGYLGRRSRGRAAAVWSDRLPSAMRERGPRVVQDDARPSSTALQGRAYVKGGDGPIVDCGVRGVLRPLPQ